MREKEDNRSNDHNICPEDQQRRITRKEYAHAMCEN